MCISNKLKYVYINTKNFFELQENVIFTSMSINNITTTSPLTTQKQQTNWKETNETQE